MFAIIATGGKQYQVNPGQTLEIEKIDGKKGDKISFDQILLMSDGEKTEVGTPYLSTPIKATIEEQGRGEKIDILRFRAKSRYRKHKGHRQSITTVTIGKFAFAKTTPKKEAK